LEGWFGIMTEDLFTIELVLLQDIPRNLLFLVAFLLEHLSLEELL
jgi:hypothetical protein